MNHFPEQPNGRSSRSPLLPIGIIVLSMLTLPALLSSTVPDGPVKVGDVVFSTDRHRVYFLEPARFTGRGYSGFCLIEPREQLLITRHPATRADGAFTARILVQGPRDFPLCPSHADVVVQPHQITLNATVWRGLADLLARLVSP